MMQDYAEVVVNRLIIHRQPITQNDTTRIEPYEQIETRTKTFHYHIPPSLKGSLEPGHLVAVPFRHQVLQGIVVALSDESPVEKTRPVQAILDPQPVLTPLQLDLATWLAGEYLAPLANCVNLFLPPGANRQPIIVVEVISGVPRPADLSPLEQALYTYLQQQKKPDKM